MTDSNQAKEQDVAWVETRRVRKLAGSLKLPESRMADMAKMSVNTVKKILTSEELASRTKIRDLDRVLSDYKRQRDKPAPQMQSEAEDDAFVADPVDRISQCAKSTATAIQRLITFEDDNARMPSKDEYAIIMRVLNSCVKNLELLQPDDDTSS